MKEIKPVIGSEDDILPRPQKERTEMKTSGKEINSLEDRQWRRKA